MAYQIQEYIICLHTLVMDEMNIAQSDPVEGSVIEGLAPVNPSFREFDPTTSRFSSAVWYDKVREQKIILAGCGGIGSYVGFLLGRMKPNYLTLYDPDTVEAGNLSGQLFSVKDIGRKKVAALYRLISEGSDFGHIYTITSNYEEESLTSPVMICGFDNMNARRAFFNNWSAELEHQNSHEFDVHNALFIDGRLAAEEFQVLAFTGDNIRAIERYKQEFLFSDAEAEVTLCSLKQTSYMASMIASVMVNIFTNFCANLCDLPLPREIPFLTSYRADFMELKTVYHE